MTVAPLRTSSLATARPMPDVAPVTMMMRPSKSAGVARYWGQAFAVAVVMSSVRSFGGASGGGSLDGRDVTRQLLDRLRRYEALPRLYAKIGETPRARQDHSLERTYARVEGAHAVAERFAD